MASNKKKLEPELKATITNLYNNLCMNDSTAPTVVTPNENNQLHHGRVNQNGLLVTEALSCLTQPATLMDIVKKVAEMTCMKPRVIKDAIKETVECGVYYGFIQRCQRKYYLDNAYTENQSIE